MADLVTAVTSALSGVKAATEIAKLIKEAGNAYDEAEFKLRMADLLTALAESQAALAESTQSLTEKDQEIERLKGLLAFSGKLRRHNNAYFEVNDEGELYGDPYCQHCWEASKLPVHLTYVSRSETACAACGTKYHSGYTRLPGNA